MVRLERSCTRASSDPKCRYGLPVAGHPSYSLNSSKEGYIGNYIGDYSRGY